jgi:hypothetical protein
MNAAAIEHIKMDRQGAAHWSRWGAYSLVQKVRPGCWVVGTDIVARYIDEPFRTRKAASDAATDLVLAWARASR